ncbi:Protein Y49G5B.1 [Aphelenchoides avenae]|nr:Protein Y49G5B.1 [Aphelenchus avenae]
MKALSGCWMDSDGKGRHCLCASEFCNKLVDRTQGKGGNPFSSPLPEMELLRQNPLVDYTYIEDEKNVAPVSVNGALTNTVGETVELPVNDAEDKFDGDDDLVPIDFAEYKDWESKHRQTGPQGNRADNPSLMDEFVADVDKMIGDSRTTTWRYERVNNGANEGSYASAVALMILLLIPLLV